MYPDSVNESICVIYDRFFFSVFPLYAQSFSIRFKQSDSISAHNKFEKEKRKKNEKHVSFIEMLFHLLWFQQNEFHGNEISLWNDSFVVWFSFVFFNSNEFYVFKLLKNWVIVRHDVWVKGMCKWNEMTKKGI